MPAATALVSSEIRPVRRRAHETRERIEASALDAFADAGFDGASTGEIARRSGVTQQLVIYHYGTKLELWKTVADRVFGEMRSRSLARFEGLQGIDDATRARVLVREFVRFSAQVPQLGRFMMHESNRPGPRLTWLVERHVRSQFEQVRDAFGRAQESGWAVEGDPAHLVFLIMGSAALSAGAAQAELLLGPDALSPERIDAFAELVVRAILPDAASPAAPKAAS